MMKQMDLFKLPPMTFAEMMADLAKRVETVIISEERFAELTSLTNEKLDKYEQLNDY
jgi:hypothetical protein